MSRNDAASVDARIVATVPGTSSKSGSPYLSNRKVGEYLRGRSRSRPWRKRKRKRY
jgi:hypothetical protein